MKIVIAGAGYWGTAIAQVLTDGNNRDVILWDIRENVVNDINNFCINKSAFPNIKLNNIIKATSNMNIFSKANLIVIAIKSNALDMVIGNIVNYISKPVYWVNLVKSLVNYNKINISEFYYHKIPTKLIKAIVSIMGPSYAIDTINKDFTIVESVSKKYRDAKLIASIFQNEYFHLQPSTNVESVELCSTFKNVISIITGIVKGLGYSNNALSYVFMVGLQEMLKICKIWNVKIETFFNFSQLGDLLLTATSMKSRNFKVGYEIGNINNTNFLKESKITIEGIGVAKICYLIIKKYSLDCPLFTIAYKILYQNLEPKKAITKLFKQLANKNY